jgi:hypothetical protein
VSWWLAGTSMVATTFAADTPLAVTGCGRPRHRGELALVEHVMSGMLTVFFSRGCGGARACAPTSSSPRSATGGKPAAFLRGFRALYLGIPINCIIMGWVNLAMVKILMMIFASRSCPPLGLVLRMMVITAWISTLSGLWGVLVMDMFQFVLKMGMVIVLAYSRWRRWAAWTALKSKLHALTRPGGGPGGARLDPAFMPDVGSPWMPMIAFFVYIAVNWWATWYPGAEPGGGGYIAQRIFCAKDEKHSLLATLWFNIAHYAMRPWPWVLTALCSSSCIPTSSTRSPAS